MRNLLALVGVLACSGCCCRGMEFTDTEPWKIAVLNETANPQVLALDAGTANVFEIEVSYPVGWTQDDENAALERAARREVTRLQGLLDAGAPREALEAAPARAQQRSSTVRFVVLNPDAAGHDGFVGGTCTACVPEAVAHHAVLLRTSGLAPVDLHNVTREQLLNGVELHGRFSVGSPADVATMTLDAPAEGRATLRLIESCKANVLLVDKKVETSPRTFEEQVWYELRDTPCARDATTSRDVVGPEFRSDVEPPSQKLVELLRKKFEQLATH